MLPCVASIRSRTPTRKMRQRTDYNTAVQSHQSRPITDSCSVAPLPVSRLVPRRQGCDGASHWLVEDERRTGALRWANIGSGLILALLRWAASHDRETNLYATARGPSS